MDVATSIPSRTIRFMERLIESTVSPMRCAWTMVSELTSHASSTGAGTADHRPSRRPVRKKNAYRSSR
jgi:hypothetical protein